MISDFSTDFNNKKKEIKRVKIFLFLATRKLFYNYYIEAHFEYCNIYYIV